MKLQEIKSLTIRFPDRRYRESDSRATRNIDPHLQCLRRTCETGKPGANSFQLSIGVRYRLDLSAVLRFDSRTTRYNTIDSLYEKDSPDLAVSSRTSFQGCFLPRDECLIHQSTVQNELLFCIR